MFSYRILLVCFNLQFKETKMKYIRFSESNSRNVRRLLAQSVALCLQKCMFFDAAYSTNRNGAVLDLIATMMQAKEQQRHCKGQH